MSNVYNVYKAGKVYILAVSDVQAKKMLDYWAPDGKDELIPLIRLKSEAPWPCIVEDLDWEVPLHVLVTEDC